jgi:hypothetical protein
MSTIWYLAFNPLYSCLFLCLTQWFAPHSAQECDGLFVAQSGVGHTVWCDAHTLKPDMLATVLHAQLWLGWRWVFCCVSVA